MKRTRITSNHFYSFYRRMMRLYKKKKGLIKDRNDLMDLQSLIWETVADHYLNNEGGVYIDNIGYLCHMMIPCKMLRVSDLFGTLIHGSTNGYKYKHMVLCLDSDKTYFQLDISKALQKKSNDKMSKGKRYKFLYREVMSKIKTLRRERIPVIYKKEELKCE